jgi:hypothetical protein
VVSIGWVKVGLYSVLCRATTRTQPERETHPESDTAVRNVTEIHIYDIMQRVCQICNDIGQSGSGPQPLQLVPFLGEHPTIAFAKRTASDCTDKKGYNGSSGTQSGNYSTLGPDWMVHSGNVRLADNCAPVPLPLSGSVLTFILV